MKIAFITLMGAIPWGGSEELWYRTALYAKRQGHEVFCSVYRFDTIHPKIQNLIDNKIEVDFRQRFNSGGNLFYKTKIYLQNRITYLQDNYKKLLKFNPDVILISQGGTYDIITHNKDLREVLVNLNKPFFIVCHNNTENASVLNPELIELSKQIFKSAKKMFFVSEKNRNSAKRQLYDNLENSTIVKNPLNLNKFEIQTFNKEEIINFAIVGILNPNHKGQDILFEILSKQEWQERNWILNIYGNGAWEEYLKKLAIYFKIENKIFFRGHVSDIENLWQKNHILLMPSIGEGLPNTLLEAMICGRSAVVSDVGGNTEVIFENQTGFIAEAPTVYSFGKALKRAWENKDKWEQMGKNAHNFAIKFIDKEPDKTLLNLIIEKTL